MAALAQPTLVPAPTQAITTSAVKQARIGSLTDDDIIDQIKRQRQESIDRMQNIMNVALTCWEQSRNKQDFSDKASWQSRITLAKAHAAVKHFVANIMRLMTQSEQWVNVEDVAANPQMFMGASVAQSVESGVLRAAELAGFKEPFRDALETSGATMFGALKVIWQHTPYQSTTIEDGSDGLQLRQRTTLAGSLGIFSIDPWKIHFGPNTRGGTKIDWVVEDSDADLSELLESGSFENLEQVLKQGTKENKVTSDDENHRKDFKGDTGKVRQRVELWEYWGDIIDPKTQRILARNQHIIIANGQFVIKLQENRLWDKKPPYIFFSPLIVAGRFPGAGILEMNVEVKKAIDRIAQMWEDHLHFSVIPMWEADMSTLENPEDVGSGVYPGKIFRKKMGSAGLQTFRPLDIRPLTGESFNTVLAFDKEYQRGTFITEQTQGLIDAKGETTATEVQQTAIASTLILSDIAAHLELQLLSPLGEMIWDRLFQFLDITSMPNWGMLIGPQGQLLDMLPQQLRMEIVRGQYVFKARGLSRAIERSAQRNQLVSWIQTLSQLGPVQAIVNFPALITEVHESYHLPNANSLLVPNWQAVFQQIQAAMLAQANPMAQLEAKNAANEQKMAEQHEQIVTEKSLDGRNAILTEAAKATFNPKPKEKDKKK